jgi:hypothetical protein
MSTRHSLTAEGVDKDLALAELAAALVEKDTPLVVVLEALAAEDAILVERALCIRCMTVPATYPPQLSQPYFGGATPSSHSGSP